MFDFPLYAELVFLPQLPLDYGIGTIDIFEYQADTLTPVDIFSPFTW